MSARRRSAKERSLFEPAETMDRLAGEWFETACSRRSRRAFDGVEVEEAVLGELEGVCLGFRPHADARVELWRHPESDLFRGIVGSYGKVSGARHVLAFIAGPGTRAEVHAGYTGEAVVLEATRLGLGTCWVGGFFDHSAANAFNELAEGERVVALSPVGYPSERYTLSEQLMRLGAGSHRRKPVEEIAPSLSEEWPCWARAAVECARLAPSARNRQPWRFRLKRHRELTVSRDTAFEVPLVTKALDCGIAMLHAEVGARAAGVKGAWSDLEDEGLDLAIFTPDAGA
jgi:nitroreductase